MTRFCKACQRQRPLRDFDLSADVPHVSCRACEREPAASDVSHEGAALRARQARQEQIADLEDRRRSLIASLVRIDAEIAALRAGPPASPVVDDSDDVFS